MDSRFGSLECADITQPIKVHFSPYAQNGGTILAIAGEDYAIVASDTRLSDGFSILSRKVSKSYNLTNKAVLTCVGSHNDVITLTKNIQARMKMYQHENNKKMSTSALAAMLSTMLYYKRFFPYYIHNIIGGLDEEGKGCVYSFDPVGSYEREEYRAGGTGSSMIQPVLDNQIGYKNQINVEKVPLTLEKAIPLVKDIFICASERDIYTGDTLEIKIITKDGIRQENFELRSD